MGDVLVDSRMIFLREMTVNEESTVVKGCSSKRPFHIFETQILSTCVIIHAHQLKGVTHNGFLNPPDNHFYSPCPDRRCLSSSTNDYGKSRKREYQWQSNNQRQTSGKNYGSCERCP